MQKRVEEAIEVCAAEMGISIEDAKLLYAETMKHIASNIRSIDVPYYERTVDKFPFFVLPNLGTIETTQVRLDKIAKQKKKRDGEKEDSRS